ncbi:hypothetical protein PHSY_007186 [Pseudozyma hubeiensis SY62]|uniref:Uncharacterized protein n=1 Tax=Pseudozyma hubeiensis (strain SY62) TaxID=1305764 RepID=R9PDX7_PSEHS|nr:hypothetical protein PHSY_007186 [Pseudozyma hubeiensis SY62]GAC99583.1 hypothetical protein PHSY_007186 [Pseudozyma hubeiensis SY62]
MADDQTADRRTKVLAWGSNLFDQIPRDKDDGTSQSSILQDAASVVAVCTYQTVCRSKSGKIKAYGEAPSLVEKACRDLLQDTKVDDRLVFVGHDIFEAILDVKSDRCCFLRYAEDDEEEGGRYEMIEGCGWETAAVDGRGRCMALDLEGRVYLFDSVAMFRITTGQSEAAITAREAARFTAHPCAEGSPAKEAKAPAPLPKFDKISAGNAHFALLSHSSRTPSPVWIFGDARFGAIPMQPFSHTTLVGKLPLTKAKGKSPSSDLPTTDVRYLMPVPYFSPHEGFPSRIANISAGSRHNLVLTSGGDLYGWGWNEDSPLLPFDSSPTNQGWDTNIVSEPTLIPLPSAPKDELSLTAIAASNGRSFGITTEGQLVIAGSNEFGCLGLDKDLGGAEKKPRFEREFSQIKKEYECVNGWQVHPSWKEGEEIRRVMRVDATMLATFITVETTA